MASFRFAFLWSGRAPLDWPTVRSGLLAGYFLFMAGLAVIRLAYAYRPERHVWILGDWLINYQGGFVRRGLPGQVAYWLGTRWFDPGLVAAGMIALVYVLFLGFSYLNLRAQPSLWPYYLFFWAPFLFWFPVLDIHGGYRKEILFLALLAGLVWRVGRAPARSGPAIFAALGLYPILLLSHEALLAYLPYVGLVAEWARARGARLPGRVWYGLWAANVVVWLGVIMHPGTAHHEQAILASLAPRYPISAQGAIGWLDRTLAFQFRNYAPRYLDARLMAHFGAFFPAAGLAFVPLAPRLRWWWRRLQTWAWGAASGIMTLALMAVAKDWGRFWYVHAAAWFLLCLLDRTPLPWRLEPRALYGLYLALGPLYAHAWWWHHVRGVIVTGAGWPFWEQRVATYLSWARQVREWLPHLTP